MFKFDIYSHYSEAKPRNEMRLGRWVVYVLGNFWSNIH